MSPSVSGRAFPHIVASSASSRGISGASDAQFAVFVADGTRLSLLGAVPQLSLCVCCDARFAICVADGTRLSQLGVVPRQDGMVVPAQLGSVSFIVADGTRLSLLRVLSRGKTARWFQHNWVLSAQT